MISSVDMAQDDGKWNQIMKGVSDSNRHWCLWRWRWWRNDGYRSILSVSVFFRSQSFGSRRIK